MKTILLAFFAPSIIRGGDPTPTLEQQLETVRNELATSNESLTTITAERDRLNGEITNLNTQVATHQETITNLTKSLGTANESVTKLTGQVSTLQASEQAAKAELATVKEQVGQIDLKSSQKAQEILAKITGKPVAGATGSEVVPPNATEQNKTEVTGMARVTGAISKSLARQAEAQAA